MKINYWKVATIIFICFLLIGLGYESHFWLTPTVVKAQETETTAPAGRFQIVSNMLLDTVTGRMFRFYDDHGPGLMEIPIKSCADADCKTLKGAKDAR
jgi:hypothetical protein